MTHLSSINVLALDIAKLSQTLTALSAEMDSALTHENAASKQLEKKAATPKAAKEVEKTGETSSLETSTGATKATVTIEQVRAVMAEKSQAGLTSQVKERLESFGAAKLSSINPDNYEALLEAAKHLE